jgi:hypothetical protein
MRGSVPSRGLEPWRLDSTAKILNNCVTLSSQYGERYRYYAFFYSLVCMGLPVHVLIHL